MIHNSYIETILENINLYIKVSYIACCNIDNSVYDVIQRWDITHSREGERVGMMYNIVIYNFGLLVLIFIKTAICVMDQNSIINNINIPVIRNGYSKYINITTTLPCGSDCLKGNHGLVKYFELKRRDESCRRCTCKNAFDESSFASDTVTVTLINPRSGKYSLNNTGLL